MVVAYVNHVAVIIVMTMVIHMPLEHRQSCYTNKQNKNTALKHHKPKRRPRITERETETEWKKVSHKKINK